MSAADVLLSDRKYVSSVSRSFTGAEKDRTFRFFAPAGGGGGLGGAAAPNRNETSRVATPSRTVGAATQRPSPVPHAAAPPVTAAAL